MVELFAGEPESIERLRWPVGDPLANVNGLSRHGGKTYLAHRADGACVFLNESNGLCRIHEQFGADAKPTACRIFPFQITPTFAGEASVSARYDCPTVRTNTGDTHAEQLPFLRKFTDRWPDPDGFDEATCCGLERDQIIAISEFIATLQNGLPTADQRALFIPYLCDVLAITAADGIDRPALASAFGPLKSQIEAAAAGSVKRPGLIARAAFRTLLALHLRRDEDVLDGRAGRVSRLIAMLKVVLGFGTFRGLGLSHPKGSLRSAKLFRPTFAAHALPPDTFALLWRLLRNKLEALQFMGPANGDRDFLRGLHSLALLYPLTIAAAKHHAASRSATAIEPIDAEMAVAAIEHSFGRAAVLRQPSVRSIERLLLDRETITRLVRAI